MVMAGVAAGLLGVPGLADDGLSFEGATLPECVRSEGGGRVSLSDACYKDGRKSLHWQYEAGASLVLEIPGERMSERVWREGGMRMWVYRRMMKQRDRKASGKTDRGATSPGSGEVLRVEFLDAQGEVLAGFDYYLQEGGWRACWMAFRCMEDPEESTAGEVREAAVGGEGKGAVGEAAAGKVDEAVAGKVGEGAAGKAGGVERQGRGKKVGRLPVACRLIAPPRAGELWLDRVVLPESKADPRTAPDAQTPHNALVSPIQLGHWCSLWPWESMRWDLPLRAPCARARREMSALEKRVTEAMRVPRASQDEMRRLEVLWERFAVRSSPGCGGFTGAPLVCADECRPEAGEVTWRDLDELMGLLARAAEAGDASAAERYGLLWEYALDQGFAFGSCMGTNHHYGYATRWIFRSAWVFREVLARHAAYERILSALAFWSGLQETRRPVASDLADRCDGWNTLLLPRLMVALMEPDLAERERKLRGLARWMNGSLETTPGTLGGIKADGTVFHHSGFYPAYANDGLDAVGRYAELCAGTAYGLDERGRTQLRRALETMRACCNVRDWPLGISGRHPFRFGMTDGCVEAFARLAAVEKDAAAAASLWRDYAWLRSMDGGKPAEESAPERVGNRASRAGAASGRAAATGRGAAAVQAPQGFFAFNHAAVGVYRVGKKMVLMKGFNHDVWGSEIYQKDNRFGRYQSYGSVCILGGGSPVTQSASGFSEPGWDWNRVPGATTIHLPLELLESPRASTLMAHNVQGFGGAGSLEGRAGMFALDLQEASYKNFTPDFTARKSVFCCEGLLLCLGSAISNTNDRYATETTLFQCSREACERGAPASEGWVSDGVGQCFHVLEGELRRASGLQRSRENKTKRETQGEFEVAWLDHGRAPKDARYAYVVSLMPASGKGASSLSTAGEAFELLEHSRALHAARHVTSGVYAYAAFEAAEVERGPVKRLPAGVIVLCRMGRKGDLVLSVTDPNLHLPRHGFNVTEAGVAVQHELLLRGAWRLARVAKGVSLSEQGEDSRLTVSCSLGLPVELQLLPGAGASR